MYSLLGLSGFSGVVGNDLGLVVDSIILGLEDLDQIGHNLLGGSVTDLGGLHDLDLEAEDTSSEFNVADGNVDEVDLGLTGGDLVTSGVLLGLGALTTDLSGDHDLATDGATTAHDGTDDVVSSVTDGETGEELVLESLNVGGSGEVLVKGKGLKGELKLVILVVEVVSLFDEGLDFLNLAGLCAEEVLAVGGADADLGAHVGGTDFDTSVTFHTEGSHEELVELSLENTVSDELSLGIDLLDLLVCHLYEFY
jgi:hypothetical protein